MFGLATELCTHHASLDVDARLVPDLGDAAALSSKDGRAQEVAGAATSVPAVPVQLPHHVDRRLGGCLVQASHALRTRRDVEQALGGVHVVA